MTGSKRRIPALAAVLAACAGLSVGGCSLPALSKDDGPLRVLGEGDIRSIYPPFRGAKQWEGSFGSLLLCVEPSQEAQIDAIYYRGPKHPANASPVIREMPAATERAGTGSLWNPFLTRLGSPFRSSRTDPRTPGTLTRSFAGFTVRTPCSTDPDDAYTELITVIRTWRGGGGQVDGITIEYTADGEEYTETVEPLFILCGATTVHPEYCPPTRLWFS